MPFQRMSFSGSTKNSQTVSGLAAIEIVRSTTAVSVVASMLPSLLLLCFAFEGFQARVPEALEELAELLEALGPHAVQASRAVSSLAHEPRLLEDVQMLGDGRARDVEVRGDLARTQFAVADEGQDLPPPRCGDRLQCSLHGSYVSRDLRKKQLTLASPAGRMSSRCSFVPAEARSRYVSRARPPRGRPARSRPHSRRAAGRSSARLS